MSVSALFRLTPVFDPRIIDDPKLARSLIVPRGPFETISRDGEIPVVIDHADEREEANVIGRVRELSVFPDVTGGIVRDWYFASVELSAPPSWIRRGCGVSWSHIPLATQDVNGTTRLLRGVITEVSVLSPSVEPAESMARVCLLGDARSPAAGTSDRLAAGETIVHTPPGAPIRRYFETDITVR